MGDFDGSKTFGGSVDEFLALRLEDEQWVVDPFLPAGGKMLLYGETGVGKSQVAMTMALAVLQGVPFLGKFQTRLGNVCYLQADMPLVEWYERMEISTKHLASRAGFYQIYCSETLDIIAEAHDRKPSQYREWILEFDPVLLIVDVLSETHRLNENDNSVPGPVYHAWRKIAGPKPGILFVHHEKKPSEFRNNKYAFSGAHKWLDLCSSSLRVYEQGKSVILENPKAARNSKRMEKLVLKRDEETLLVYPQKPVEAVFHRMVEEGKPATEIVREVTDITKYRDGIIARRTVYDRLEKMGYQKKTDV